MYLMIYTPLTPKSKLSDGYVSKAQIYTMPILQISITFTVFLFQRMYPRVEKKFAIFEPEIVEILATEQQASWHDMRRLKHF